MSNKTPIIIIAILIIAFVVYVGVTGDKALEEKETIKIGAILPLSGEIANWGTDIEGGMKLAIEEINKAGGIDNKNFQVIYEDDQCDKTKAVTAAQKLIDIDKVKIIIGPLCSGSVVAAAPVAENAKIVMLGFGSTAAISDAGDYIFRHTYSDADQGKFLAEQIYNSFGFKNINAIYVNNDYGIGLFDGLKKTFSNLGGTVASEQPYDFETADFRTILTKIKNSPAEALLLVSYGKEGGLLAKQAKELGINLQIFATDNFGAQDVITVGEDAVNGVIFSASIPPDEKNPRIKSFKEQYSVQNNSEPGVLWIAASGYDAANITINAIKESGYDSDSIKNYFYSLKNYPGLAGDISFDGNGDATKDFMLQTVKDGKFVPYVVE